MDDVAPQSTASNSTVDASTASTVTVTANGNISAENTTAAPISVPSNNASFLATQKVTLTCRFYEEKYPEKEQVVVARVREIAEMGAYANLLEYNSIEGMILMSELSRRRIRSVNKLIRQGRDEYVVVLRVDPEKGYIDLSKRRTSPEDHRAADNRYQKAKSVNSIVRHTATNLNLKSNDDLESLMARAVWYLDKKYKKENEPYRQSYDVFKKAVDDPTVLDECDLTPAEREQLLLVIRHRMMPTPEKIRADVSVQCTGKAGVDAVKAALQAGIDAGLKAAGEGINGEDANGDANISISTNAKNDVISITLIAPPEYVITTQSLDRENGIQLVWEALRAIEKRIGEFEHGKSKIKVEPRVVGDHEDAQLKAAMEQALAANTQVAGDDNEE